MLASGVFRIDLKAVLAVLFAIAISERVSDRVIAATQTPPVPTSTTSCPHQLDKDGNRLWKPTDADLHRFVAGNLGFVAKKYPVKSGPGLNLDARNLETRSPESTILSACQNLPLFPIAPGFSGFRLPLRCWGLRLQPRCQPLLSHRSSPRPIPTGVTRLSTLIAGSKIRNRKKARPG
jgi:hypothetical protein